MRPGRALLAAAALGMFLVGPRELPSCGFVVSPLFTHVRQPFAFLERYAGGKLGVIHPGYYRKHLFVAYRFMSGRPLSAQEQQLFVDGWDGSDGLDGVKEWLEARARIPGVVPVEIRDLDRKVPGSQFQTYLNCGQDAFHAAAGTLFERASSFGATHPGVKRWLAAQDMVFSNCTGGDRIPPAAESDLPAVLKADRAYQFAAARFYAQQFEEAETAFRAIAADRSSSWSTVAPYVAARCRIRRATLGAGEGKVDPKLLAEAAEQLRAVLADSSRSAVHGAAGSLLDFVRARLEPDRRLEEIAAALLDGKRVDDFGRNLTDLQYLLDRATAPAPGAARKAPDLVDWIWTFQAARPTNDRAAHPLARWESTRSLPWLVAALASVNARHRRLAELLDAAEKVPAASSGYPTALYHRLRLLVDADRAGEARAELDRVLPGLRRSLTRSSLNMLLAGRLQLAQSLDELLQNAPRVPEGEIALQEEPPDPDPSGTRAPLFDADAVASFNRFLPLARLEQAAGSRLLPATLRAQVAMATFVRALLLDDDRTAGALAAGVARLHPELPPLLESYRTAPAGAAKRFAAVYLLLKAPGLKPYIREGMPRTGTVVDLDSLRDNWWCGLAEVVRGRPREWQHEALPLLSAPGFLQSDERAALERELTRLSQLPTGQSYLGDAVLEWAQQNPNDPRVPEALYLVVRSTRFGCSDDRTGPLSKSAFDLLHARYAGSRWAAQTPYWFK
jgi:hypothetical protein